jgi:hypothetical protein
MQPQLLLAGKERQRKTDANDGKTDVTKEEIK